MLYKYCKDNLSCRALPRDEYTDNRAQAQEKQPQDHIFFLATVHIFHEKKVKSKAKALLYASPITAQIAAYTRRERAKYHSTPHIESLIFIKVW